MPHYGVVEYWDQRYTREPSAFDWYQSYGGLRHILHQYLPCDQPILQVGVGTSRVQEDMVKHGYTSITNIDFSSVAIKHMAEQHSHIPGLVYKEADVRHLEGYEADTFGGLFDKGTLDAIMSSPAGNIGSKKMLAECSRVMKPGAAMVLVSWGSPSARLRCLTADEARWVDLCVYCITKPAGASDGAHEYERPVSVTTKGPFMVEDADAMAALDSLAEDVHYVYVMRKTEARPSSPLPTRPCQPIDFQM